MKSFKACTCTLALLFISLCYQHAAAQSFGLQASAVWISNCTQNTYYNTTGSAANPFNNTNLGVYTQGSGSLILRGGQVRTSKVTGINICNVRLYYRVYLQSAAP